MIDNYEKRRTKPDFGALCDEDIEILKNWHWNPNITGDYAEFLTAQVFIFSLFTKLVFPGWFIKHIWSLIMSR